MLEYGWGSPLARNGQIVDEGALRPEFTSKHDAHLSLAGLRQPEVRIEISLGARRELQFAVATITKLS